MMVAAIVSASDTAASSDAATSRLGFRSAEASSKVLDHEKRDAWQLPQAVVDSLRILPGSRVADIGAGTGYFNKYLAAAVGPTGFVFAQEIEPELVAHMRERAEEEETSQVVPLLGRREAADVPDSLDLVFLCNTYRYIDGRIAYFAALRESLLPGGRLAVVGFRRHPSDPSPARIPPEQVTSELEKAGYVVLTEYDFLPKQYFMIYGLPEQEGEEGGGKEKHN